MPENKKRPAKRDQGERDRWDLFRKGTLVPLGMTASLLGMMLVGTWVWAAEPEKWQVDEEYKKRRKVMVEEQLAQKRITDQRVLEAMGTVPREIFIRPGLRFRAYQDTELPGEKKQFLSRPYEWARAFELLDVPEEGRVLVLDPGVGYAGAVVSQMAREAYVVVTVPELLLFVQQRYQKLNYSNLMVKSGSLLEGWPERAPYDRILIAGVVAREIPYSLIDQLGSPGILLAVTGTEFQKFARYTKNPDAPLPIVRTLHDPCHFPPLELKK